MKRAHNKKVKYEPVADYSGLDMLTYGIEQEGITSLSFVTFNVEGGKIGALLYFLNPHLPKQLYGPLIC